MGWSIIYREESSQTGTEGWIHGYAGEGEEEKMKNSGKRTCIYLHGGKKKNPKTAWRLTQAK